MSLPIDNSSDSTPEPPVLIHAAAAVDADGVSESPAAVLMQNGEIVATGSPQHVGRPAQAVLVDHTDAVLIPGLVNAHAHLDLTHIGPQPFTGAFSDWAEMIRRSRRTDDQAIRESVNTGIELSLAGGTAIIGDIAGEWSTVPVETLRDSPLRGTCFVEVFGLGARQQHTINTIHQQLNDIPHRDRNITLGIQPHAMYSCGLDVYRAAVQSGVPVATHLAETLEEIQFVEKANGPLRDFLINIGIPEDGFIAHRQHPVDVFLQCVNRSEPRAPILAAHLNYVEDHHIQLLAQHDVSIAYCPRGSAYFGHPHGNNSPHRYRDMSEAGVNVALGTDSIIGLDTPDRISVLDDMRYLYKRDHIDPQTLLHMATVAGAKALDVDPALVTLTPGPIAGLIAIRTVGRAQANPPRVLGEILESTARPQWIIPQTGKFEPNHPSRSDT